jgi:hypothetical protein
LRDDFQRCAAKITASGFEVQFRAYPIIDELAWDNIRTGIGAQRTWFFTLLFGDKGQTLRYIFFFGKHFWKAQDTPADRREPRIALLISEESPDHAGELLHRIDNCPIALREIFSVGTELVGVTLAPGKDPDSESQYLRGASGLKLAQEFIEHVLLRRLQ